MSNLYSFYLDCGRMGSLDGLFIAEKHEVEALRGKTVYFGEVLGKHSEVWVDDFDPDTELKLVTDNPVDIEVITRILGAGTISGFNPLDYFDSGYNED